MPMSSCSLAIARHSSQSPCHWIVWALAMLLLHVSLGVSGAGAQRVYMGTGIPIAHPDLCTGNNCPTYPPNVIVGGSGTYTQPAAPITVTVCDSMSAELISVTLNGTDITATLISTGAVITTIPGCHVQIVATGLLTLVPGTNTVEATGQGGP